MNRIPVKSSNIKSVGWLDGVLECEFVAGMVYAFQRVPREKYDALLAAPSAGKYLAKEIKPYYAAVSVK